jgi:hypothetical protein
VEALTIVAPTILAMVLVREIPASTAVKRFTSERMKNVQRQNCFYKPNRASEGTDGFDVWRISRCCYAGRVRGTHNGNSYGLEPTMRVLAVFATQGNYGRFGEQFYGWTNRYFDIERLDEAATVHMQDSVLLEGSKDNKAKFTTVVLINVIPLES